MMPSKKGSIVMKIHYFFSQPHQPFFLLAFVNALIAMLLFMLAYKGMLPLVLSPVYFHAYSLIFLLFTPAFLAFLFTTFPRFSSTSPISHRNYLGVFTLFATGTLLYLIGTMMNIALLHTAMLLLFVGHLWAVMILWQIYRISQMPDKDDQKWILAGMSAGIIAHGLFLLSEWIAAFYPLAIQIAIYLYLFFVAISVAQRMVPFFSHCMIEKNRRFLPTLLLLLILHVMLEVLQPHLGFLADFVLAYLTGREILRWNLPFPNPNPLLWILHLALYWVPVAFLFGAMSNLTAWINGTEFLFLDIHILILGFVFTILIGFGTRVTLGHSDNRMEATLWEKVLFNWTQVVVVLRLLTSMAAAWGWDFMLLFDLSVAAWLTMFTLWGIRFFALLIYGKKLS
jgi:uncharacterized protein involved in response to NO